MDGPPPQRWDRSKWITVFSSHSPTIREVTECLGLGLSPSASATNRGIPKFDAPEFKKLSSEVTRLSKELPQDRDALLDFAADPNALQKELDELMNELGKDIWGKDADRSRLLTADSSRKTYYKDLYYEDPEDRDILKIHLQRWVVIKACYWIRNRKLKKHSVGDDYETSNDIEAGSPAERKPDLAVKQSLTSSRGSPTYSESPQSATPPGTGTTGSPPLDSTCLPLQNLRKRKSSVFHSHSDGEDVASNASSTGARKRSYHSQTMPIQRKSPRKGLPGRLSTENIPPLPSSGHLQDAMDTSSNNPAPATSDTARRQLSPLSSSALNGGGRPLAPMQSSFSAVNGPSPPVSASPAVPPHSSPHAFASVNAPASIPTSSPSTFATVNALTSAPSSTPSSFAAVNAPIVPSSTTSSSFSAVNAPNGNSPKNTPSTLAPANVSNPTSANATPSSFSAVNAPSGFTAVNSSGSATAPIAPNHRSYASPYNGEQNGHDVRGPVNGHSEPIPHHPAPLRRDSGPQPVPRHNSADGHMPPNVQNGHPPINGTHPASMASQQHTFHSHHIPPGSGAPSLHPKPHTNPHVNGNTLANAHILPSNAPHRPAINGHAPDPRPVPRPGNDTEMVLLQCDLLGLLMRYLFPRDASRLDEQTLVHNLEYIWSRNEPAFRAVFGPMFAHHASILHSWIEERRKTSQLQYILDTQPAVRPQDTVDRVLAMNDLRILRLKWKALKIQDGAYVYSAEDVLCKTFATMTRTDGTEALFKNGLEALNERLFDFLKSEDMKICVSKVQ